MSAIGCPSCQRPLPDSIVKGPEQSVVRCEGCGTLLLWSHGKVVRSAKSASSSSLKAVETPPLPSARPRTATPRPRSNTPKPPPPQRAMRSTKMGMPTLSPTAIGAEPPLSELLPEDRTDAEVKLPVGAKPPAPRTTLPIGTSLGQIKPVTAPPPTKAQTAKTQLADAPSVPKTAPPKSATAPLAPTATVAVTAPAPAPPVSTPPASPPAAAAAAVVEPAKTQTLRAVVANVVATANAPGKLEDPLHWFNAPSGEVPTSNGKASTPSAKTQMAEAPAANTQLPKTQIAAAPVIETELPKTQLAEAPALPQPPEPQRRRPPAPENLSKTAPGGVDALDEIDAPLLLPDESAAEQAPELDASFTIPVNRRRRMMIGAVAVLALAVVVLLVFVVRRGSAPTEPVVATSKHAPLPPAAAPPPVAKPVVAAAPAPVPAPPVAAPRPVVARAADPAPEPESPPASPARHRLGGRRVVIEDDGSHTKSDSPAAPTDPPAAQGDLDAARASYKKGNAALFAGRADDAVELYQESLKEYPGYVAGYRGLGLAYAEQGRNADAIKALKSYVKNASGAKDLGIIKKRIERLSKLK